MLNKAKWLILLVVCLMFISSPLFAGGFNLYEHGAKSTALAGAFTARADNASAIYFNPAGIVQLDGWNAYMGASIVQPLAKFTGEDPYPGYGVEEEAKHRLFMPPGMYLTNRVHEKVAVGLGIYAPFAIGTEWDDPDFSGRYISYKTDLAGIFVTPSVAAQVHDMVSIGLNLNLVYSSVHMERIIGQVFNGDLLDIARLKITGDNGIDIGFDIGTIIKPMPKMQIGLLYRATVNNTYDGGEAEFEQIMTGMPAVDGQIAAGLPTAADGGNTIGIATEIPFPWQIVGGIMYQPTDKVTLELDIIQWGWSEFDELVFDFAKEQETGDINTPDNSVNVEDYEDSAQYRFGIEYQATEQLALRAGYVYDKSPVPDKSVSVLLPDANRNDYSFGFGYKVGDMTIDAAYMLVDFDERSTNGVSTDEYNGTYKSIVNIFGLSVGYSF